MSAGSSRSVISHTTPRHHSPTRQDEHFRSDVSTPPPPQFRGTTSGNAVIGEVFTAAYSGVAVLEMTCRGVSVMRRRSDSALNATQILKVAGIQKGNRTKILEREILTGPHEKVQGGYGKYQGTWIPYDIGVTLCERHSVREILAPLLELDTTCAPAMHATPTKEQHQASIRRQQSQIKSGNGRSTASGPGPSSGVFESHRPQAKGTSAMLLASLQHGKSATGQAESFQNKRQSISASDPAATRFLSNKTNGSQLGSAESWNGAQTFFAQLNKHTDTATARVPLETVPQHPLTPATARDFEHSREVMTNIFLESDHGRVPDILLQSPSKDLDLDVPIDELGHTALHWAAALARLSLVETLVSRGASPSRGNANGETALMRAVMATNTMDQNSFLELLDALGASLAMRDSANRTVLHHIAITAGIKGRSAASKYYLTSLLEWVVKSDHSIELDLNVFNHVLVDSQDRNGDTALNIAARIGNRGIVQSLLEVDADPYLHNKAGVRPIDSGIVDERIHASASESREPVPQPRTEWKNMSIAQASGLVATEISGLLGSLQNDFDQEMEAKCRAVDESHQRLRDASKELADLRRQVEVSKQRKAELDEIGQRIRNTNNAVRTETKEYNESQVGQAPPQFGETYDADTPFLVDPKSAVPPHHILRARIRAYKQDIRTLDTLAVKLYDKSLAMEARCRKLVSICTSAPIDQVDDTLPALLAALQSDGDPKDFDLSEANRVAGFLKILS